MKTMSKLINIKTIGASAVSLALLAGTLATPAFAKGTTGYIKPAIPNNRSVSLLHRGFFRHFGGFKVVGVKEVDKRVGPGFIDYRIEYNKLTNVSGN